MGERFDAIEKPCRIFQFGMNDLDDALLLVWRRLVTTLCATVKNFISDLREMIVEFVFQEIDRFLSSHRSTNEQDSPHVRRVALLLPEFKLKKLDDIFAGSYHRLHRHLESLR